LFTVRNEKVVKRKNNIKKNKFLEHLKNQNSAIKKIIGKSGVGRQGRPITEDKKDDS